MKCRQPPTPVRKANFSAFGNNKQLASVAKDCSPRAHSRLRHEMHSGCLETEIPAVSGETRIPPAAPAPPQRPSPTPQTLPRPPRGRMTRAAVGDPAGTLPPAASFSSTSDPAPRRRRLQPGRTPPPPRRPGPARPASPSPGHRAPGWDREHTVCWLTSLLRPAVQLGVRGLGPILVARQPHELILLLVVAAVLTLRLRLAQHLAHHAHACLRGPAWAEWPAAPRGRAR